MLQKLMNPQTEFLRTSLKKRKHSKVGEWGNPSWTCFGRQSWSNTTGSAFSWKSLCYPSWSLTWRDSTEAATHYAYRGAHFSVLNHTWYPAGHWESSGVAGVAGNLQMCRLPCHMVCCLHQNNDLFVLIYEGVKNVLPLWLRLLFCLCCFVLCLFLPLDDLLQALYQNKRISLLQMPRTLWHLISSGLSETHHVLTAIYHF